MMRNRMRTALLPVAAAAALSACGGPDITYRPAAQILPAHIKKLAVGNINNQTHQFGLEDKFILRIRDEFLRDGKYDIVPESDADGVVVSTITRYILTPTQYDAVLTPIAYKLRVVMNLVFIDRTRNTLLWVEPNMEAVQIYATETVKGGITEEQARELIWDQLARNIVKRVIEGFGAVTGTSKRAISSEPPPNQPEPVLPSKPVNPNPY